MISNSERSKQVFNETVNYEQTVKAIIAFAALVIHDGKAFRPKSGFGLGRRMTVSPKGSDVTPDLVVQKSATYGVVTEVKKSMSRDEAQWLSYVQQAVKYQAPLVGWFTPDGTIKNHDTVVLVHQSRSRQFVKYIEREVKSGQMADPQFAVVEFVQSEETATYYMFRLERGTIADGELSHALEFGKQVPLDEVLKSFPNIRYGDAPAPAPLLLAHLWTDYFPSRLAEAEFDPLKKHRRIRVSAQAMTEELQQAYGSKALHRDQRSVEFPKISWINDALKRLVRFGLAEPVAGKANQYDILHRGFKKDVRRHFCDLEAKLKQPFPSQEEQISLLDQLSDVPEQGPAKAKPARLKPKRVPGRGSRKK